MALDEPRPVQVGVLSLALALFGLAGMAATRRRRG
jgi:MYXO-CTERM domain-containing protein